MSVLGATCSWRWTLTWEEGDFCWAGPALVPVAGPCPVGWEALQHSCGRHPSRGLACPQLLSRRSRGRGSAAAEREAQQRPGSPHSSRPAMGSPTQPGRSPGSEVARVLSECAALSLRGITRVPFAGVAALLLSAALRRW